MNDRPVPVTPDGLRKLEAELEELRTHKRKEVAERIHAAMQLQLLNHPSTFNDFAFKILMKLP